MSRLHPPLTPIIVAIFLAAGIVGCDSTTAINESVEASNTLATEYLDLGLTAAQAADVSAVFAEGADRNPTRVWELASRLRETLTDEQKEKLLSDDRHDRPVEHRAERRGHRNPGTEGSTFRGRARLDSILTADQKAVLETAHQEFRTRVAALRDQVQSGAISNADFRARLADMRDTMRQQFDGLLTDEQKASVQRFRQDRSARRTEMKADAVAAMTEALGLTPEQLTALEALRESTRASLDSLRDKVHAGADRSSLAAEFDAVRQTARTELESILDDAQLELHDIHRALMSAAGPRGHRGHGDRGDRREGNFRRGPWSQSGN